LIGVKEEIATETPEDGNEPDNFDNIILAENKNLRLQIAQKNNEVKILKESYRSEIQNLQNEIKTLILEN
jgi:hypothetical protein